MKKLFLAAITALTALAPTTALANTFNEHLSLYKTIQSVGVTVHINHPRYCNGRVDGSYHSRERVLSICQDGATRASVEVDWSSNDYDTLRHESHHLIQDCVRGGLGDSQLGLLFGSMNEAEEFVKSVYSPQQMRELMGSDSYSGHNAFRQMIELEAFATATVISATEITNKMIEVCR